MSRYWRHFKLKASLLRDALLFFFHIVPLQAKLINHAGDKVILFLGERLDPRIPRLTRWINKNNKYTAVILCHMEGYSKAFVSKEQGVLVFYRNEWHLRRIMTAVNVYLIHGYAPMSRFPAMAIKVLKESNKPIPFIIDYQDVYVTYFGLTPDNKLAWLKDDLTHEKFCFNNADGLVASSMEPLFGDKSWNEAKMPHRLFFPLYADNDVFTESELKISSGEIHLVYVGGLASMGDTYFSGFYQLHWLIEMLKQQKIHFHVYPNPNQSRFSTIDYEKIAEENEYFHFHKPVALEDLSAELSKYHYGLIPFFKGASAINETKFKYAATLKIFNYLEAGLPVLISTECEFQSWLTERYKLGITFDTKEDFENLGEKLNLISYEKQVENMVGGREILSLNTQIHRLTEFYDSFKK